MKSKKAKAIKESMGMNENEDHVMEDEKLPSQDNIRQVQVLEVFKFEVGSSLASEALLTEAMFNNKTGFIDFADSFSASKYKKAAQSKFAECEVFIKFLKFDDQKLLALINDQILSLRMD